MKSTKQDYPILSAMEQIKLFKQFQILVNALKSEGRSFTATNLKWYRNAYPYQERMVRAALIAKDQLVLSNDGMIVNESRKYARDGIVPVEELIQVGREACLYALTKYNPDKGDRQTKFSSYAQFWIRSRIADAVKRANQVSVPDYAIKKGLPQYRFVSHEDLSERSPSIYDRLVVDEDIDPLSILTDDEVEVLSHHYNLGGLSNDHPQLDLWGDKSRVTAIVDKVRQYAAGC